jgi:hypothetical protein
LRDEARNLRASDNVSPLTRDPFDEAIMSTMLAYRIHSFGGPEVFNAEKIDIPEPGAGEVLVRVRGRRASIRST